MAKSLRSKEYDRITQQIRRAERRGYVYDEDYKKSLKNMTYEELKSQRVKDVYASGYVVEQATGEIIQGDIAREIEKDEQRERAKRRYRETNREKVEPEFAEAMVAGWFGMWEGLNQNRAVGARFILERSQSLVDTYGYEAFAQVIHDMEEEGLIIVSAIGYDKEKAAAVMAGVQNRLWQLTNATQEEIKTEQENISDFNDDDDSDLRFYDGDEEF